MPSVCVELLDCGQSTCRRVEAVGLLHQELVPMWCGVGAPRRTPLEHLLLETDAPDLTPVPHRGRPNEPAFMVETAKKIAEIKGVTLEEVAHVTTANAERLFRLQTYPLKQLTADERRYTPINQRVGTNKW